MYDLRISYIDNGKKRGAHGQHGFRILQAPTLAKRRNGSCLEIKCDEFRDFFDMEWARSHCDELEDTQNIFPISLVNAF